MRLPALYILLLACLSVAEKSYAKGKNKPACYRLETYTFTTKQQEDLIDHYLEKAYLPALHGYGLQKIGVFKPIANDTAALKVVYVLITLPNWNKVLELDQKLQNDAAYKTNGASFLNAAFDAPAYRRREITLIQAFSMAPTLELPQLTAPLAERVYELRSYESASDNLYRNKVQMFNEGGEVVLFKRLKFNAIFYGEVIAGSRMPNLVYMTSFNSLADRNAHWEVFKNDAEWKSLSGNPIYQHNVSKADIILTRPAPYSDF